MAQFFGLMSLNAGNFDSELATDGQVLTADGSGGAAWEAAAGGGGLTDITYADLATAIGADGLIPGSFYRITDFATTHYIGAYDYYGKSFTRFDINVGSTEPLIVLAIASDKLASQAYSADFPNDVIIYDWNPDNWLVDQSFTDSYGGPIISGFKGVIISRYDTVLNIFAPGDWRNCLTRRWKTNVTAWDSGTTYYAGEIVSKDGKVYKAIQGSINQTPSGDDSYWVVILDITAYEYWNIQPGSWGSIPSGAEYYDFLLFDGGTMPNGGVYIAIDMSQVAYPYNTLLPNCVIYNPSTCFNIWIGSGFSYCTIGGNFHDNTIDTGFFNNAIQPQFYNNILGSNFQNNFIGQYFTNNAIGKEFIGNFTGNYFSGNQIGFSFRANVISSVFSGNQMGSNLNSNFIKENFVNNFIRNSSLSYLDLTAATHVYSAYNCEVYADKTLGSRLRYVDNDVDIFAAVTA